MRILTFVFETTLQFTGPVSDHSFVLRCLPKSTAAQTVMDAQLFTVPRTILNEQADGFGNRMVYGYVPQDHGQFSFCATGQVAVDGQRAYAGACHPVFAQPSPLTLADEAMTAFAREVVAGAGTCADVVTRAWALSQAVSQRMAYEPLSTDTSTTAAAAFAGARGVCQDYAHVLIALCRAVGIPARYVTGLMMGEGSTHAWVEVHDGRSWLGFDPTNGKPIDDGYLAFAVGRDFDDCPIERGIFRGDVEQVQTVSASLVDNSTEAMPGLSQAQEPAR